MPLTSYKITDPERDGASVELTRPDQFDSNGATTKSWFDVYPDLIRGNLDGLCTHLEEIQFAHTISTAAATTSKAPITAFVPIGAIIDLYFENGNTAASPTIEVDGDAHNIVSLPYTTTNPFRVKVKKTGASTLTWYDGIDYVLERATSSSWVYEKYASGKATCYIPTSTVTIGNSVAFGALYTRSTAGTNGVGLAIPSIFNATPIVFASLLGSASTITGPHGWASGAGPYTANLQVLTTVNASTGASATVCFYAIGTWK